MKYLISKEYYYYKIHTSLVKSSVYPTTSIGYPPPLPIWFTPTFLQENLESPPYYNFFKISTPLMNKGESH